MHATMFVAVECSIKKIWSKPDCPLLDATDHESMDRLGHCSKSYVFHRFVSSSVGSTPCLLCNTKNNVIDCGDKGFYHIRRVICLEVYHLDYRESQWFCVRYSYTT
jgi:hypothetical protein